MDNRYKDLEDQIKNLKEEISILKGRQNTLWGVCIVLTSIVTAIFMHMFIL
ncbi:MAG: hypothetical protein HDQ99_19865 [Lachnospiraceae bacterium]|nr:hypothetical protein [Lachnospiraceae bacterium]